MGANEDPQLEHELKSIKKEFDDLSKEEKEVDRMLEDMHKKLSDYSQNESQTQYAFLTFNDLKNLKNLTEEGENDTFLIIKAPKGTMMEVPVLDEENKNNMDDQHQLLLNSKNGEITSYIVSDDKIMVEYDNHNNDESE